jgi:SAM-dependent methyltransferase
MSGVAAGLTAAAALAPSFAAVPLPSTVGAAASTTLSYRESPAGTVVVTEDAATGARAMFVDNNAVIGSSYQALKVVRMLGLVPALLHPDPERVLVIGYGAGVTTATIAAVPGVERVVVAEIVPAVIDAARLFEHLNHRVADDPKVAFKANDGRNQLLLGGSPYDVITCDPVHPLYGSAALYSLDYFSLCRRRLRPGGVVCQYLPLHRMPTEDFRRAIATFDAAFPETWVLFGLGHAMLIGGDRPLELDWTRWQQVLDHHRLREDLAASALATPAQIAALFQLDPDGCRRIGSGPLSTDLHPRLEFLAPEAYRAGLWAANARLLVDGYRSPLDRIRGLPPGLTDDLRRLVAGKRLLLFSLLERDAGNRGESMRWLDLALEVAGDDPEVQMYAREFGDLRW